MSMTVQKRRISLASAVGATFLAALGGCGGEATTPITADMQAQEALTAGECDLSGTWAVRFVVPVKWPANAAVQGGKGIIAQYVKTVRRVEGQDLIDTLQVCGNVVPDYHSTSFAGNEHYGVVFPDELFDREVLPKMEVRSRVSGFTVGSTFQSEPAVVQVGIKMDDPLHDLWPRSYRDLKGLYDADGDGHQGVTVVPRTGGDYINPRTSISRNDLKRATKFYTAMRNVARISGTITSCEKSTGKAKIERIGDRTALNSHVLGCQKVDGSPCSAGDTNLIDGFSPQYDVDEPGEGTVTLVKVPDNVTCADVRGLQY